MKKKLLFTAILYCLAGMAFGQWTYTNLSEPKEFMGSASVGNKVYFAGGYNGTDFLDEVQVYDVSTGTWDVVDGGLFHAREFPGGSVACGSKVFFAGGFNWVTSFNTVDIYDTESEEWTVESLSDDRFSIATVSHGDTVMFAGGVDYPALVYKNVVDIYNIQTGEWSTTNLSIAREGIASAVVGNLALFAGGLTDNGVTNRVDIYNFTTKTWSQATLSQVRAFASAVTVGTKVIIAGGTTSNNSPTNRVDIYDASTNTWTQAALSSPRAAINNAATIGGKAYFVGGGKFTGSGFSDPSDVIDVYDAATNTWSVMNLQTARVQHSVNAVGNYLVVAGGKNTYGQLSSVEIYYDAPPSNIIHVPGDYPTIHAGIFAASPGDTVLVADGLYYENINFMGKKPLMVASQFIMDGDTNHIANTIINGSQPFNPDIGSVVTFETGEDTTSVLCGFTITGGTGTFIAVAGNARMGGGVLIAESGGKLLNNHIEYNIVSNEGWATGGGINATGPAVPHTWVILKENRISHNKTFSSNNQGTGGGIECWFNLVMVDNEISYNEANGAFRGDGGGGRISGNFGPIMVDIRNNLITHNKAISLSDMTDIAISGGLDVFYNISGNVSNNIISYNDMEVSDNKWSYGAGAMVEEITVDDFVFENNMIIGNKSISGYCLGGGLCIFDGNGKFQNNVIQNNNGSNGGGIGIGYNADHQAVLINNTITGNIGNIGGGLYTTSANAVVINSILWGNTAPTGASIYSVGSTLEVHYSDVEGDEVWPGEGNVNCVASFLEDGYHLSDTCQLLEKGIASIYINGTWYDCPAYDIDGDGRPLNEFPEIGADERLLVSIPEPKPANSSAFNIYPNPANDLITLSIKDGSKLLRLTITNLLGQDVYTGLPENKRLDVSKLSPGLYIFSVLTNRGEVKQKVIIE